jgi:hypothetical protein
MNKTEDWKNHTRRRRSVRNVKFRNIPMVKGYRKDWTSRLQLAVPIHFKRETPKGEVVPLCLIQQHISSAYVGGGAASCILNLGAVIDGQNQIQAASCGQTARGTHWRGGFPPPSPQNVQTGFGACPATYSICTGDSFPGSKVAGAKSWALTPV